MITNNKKKNAQLYESKDITCLYAWSHIIIIIKKWSDT